MASFIGAFATLPASDLARARTFYERTLRLRVGQESPGGFGVLYLVGTSAVFVYASEVAGTSQTAASFEVDDLGAMVTELRGRGVTFEEYDLPGLKTNNGIAEAEGERRAWLKDSEGNLLAIVERAGSAPGRGDESRATGHRRTPRPHVHSAAGGVGSE